LVEKRQIFESIPRHREDENFAKNGGRAALLLVFACSDRFRASGAALGEIIRHPRWRKDPGHRWLRETLFNLMVRYPEMP